MSDASTTRMLDAYIEQRNSPRLFLTSYFRVNQDSFHNAEHVEVDVRRAEPRIAIPIQSVNSGAREFEASLYTNIKYKPPVYDTMATISAYSSSRRQPGSSPFEDPVFRRNAQNEAFYVMGLLEDQIRRAVELQAAQIFQTGAIALADQNGTVIFPLDFGCRPSHFLTTTPWAEDGATGSPFLDIETLAREIRRHGKMRPTDLVFGSGARRRFFANTKVKAQFDNLGLQSLQSIAPEDVPQDATFFGSVVVANYRFRCWEYDGDYIDPTTLESVPYLNDNNVLMIARDGRRDLTFGGLPMFVPPEARAAQFLPSRMSNVEQGFDLTTNIWVTPDGKHLKMSAGTRPLCVPVAKDTFGCLTVA